MLDKKPKLNWVTKFVKSKEWEDYYSGLVNYTFIRMVQGGVRTGFLTGDRIPNNCVEATEEEKEIIRKDRDEKVIYPLP